MPISFSSNNMPLIPSSKNNQKSYSKDNFDLYYTYSIPSKTIANKSEIHNNSDKVEIFRNSLPDGAMVMSEKTEQQLDKKFRQKDKMILGAFIGINSLALALTLLLERGQLKFNPKGLGGTMGLTALVLGCVTLPFVALAEYQKHKYPKLFNTKNNA